MVSFMTTTETHVPPSAIPDPRLQDGTLSTSAQHPSSEQVAMMLPYQPTSHQLPSSQLQSDLQHSSQHVPSQPHSHSPSQSQPQSAQQQLQPQMSQLQQQPPQTSHQDSLDRQMIRHLLNRYSHDEISRLMQEEATSNSLSNDGASVFTSSTFSSVRSDDTPSLFDSGSSMHTGSEVSSNRGSLMSNVSSRTAKFLNRKSLSSLRSSIDENGTHEGEDLTANGQASERPSTSAKQKGAFSCGFCKEEGIRKTCTRKNDLKRHIEDFHKMDAQWFCRHRECHMVFDWQTAYKAHLKHAHGGSRVNLDDAKILLCPQTIFACGFDNCTQIFEAPNDDEALTTFKDYVGHIVKHFDEGSSSRHWSYSSRIRNLLRQPKLIAAGLSESWPESDRAMLQWRPQSSSILRKRLETRHLGDLQLLVQYATILGSDPASLQSFREDFVTPLRKQCQQVIPGHQTLPAAPDQDSFQFKISRGTNPGLAAYLASQRRVYAPRAPVRSGRSARPPMHGVTSDASSFQSSPMASQYSFQQSAQSQHQQMFDGNGQGQIPGAPTPQHQQHRMIMPQIPNRMAPDDMRAFNNVHDESPESDLDMADNGMLDASFLSQQQHFPLQYTPTSMSPSGPEDVIAGTLSLQQGPFGAYDSPHAY